MRAQDLVPAHLQKTPRRIGNQYRAPILSKQQDAILQIPQNLIEICLQRGEHLLHVAHALANPLDLVRHAHAQVLPRLLLHPLARAVGRWAPVVELHADLFQRPKRQVAQQQRHQDRGSEREAHQRQRFFQPRCVRRPQQGGAHAHMNRGKGFAVAFQRNGNVVDARLAVHLARQAERIIFLAQFVVIIPNRHRLVLVVRVGAENRALLAVRDVHIEHRQRIAVHPLQHCLQRLVVTDRLRRQRPQLFWVFWIYNAVLEPQLQGVLQCQVHLLRNHVVGVVRLLHGRVQQLAHVDHGQQSRNKQNKGRNGQNEFSFQAHSRVIESTILETGGDLSLESLLSPIRMISVVQAAGLQPTNHSENRSGYRRYLPR